MTQINDLDSIEVEHLLSSTTHAGIVKIRATSDGTVLLGQVDPDAARSLANDLMRAAARAEYEADLWRGSKAAGVDDTAIGAVLTIVRNGEAKGFGHG